MNKKDVKRKGQIEDETKGYGSLNKNLKEEI
jgi:hypothetical protein